MAINFYTRQKTINGKTYTAQFNGLSMAMRAVDETYVDGSENTSVLKMSNFILQNVIVEPKGLSVDDFEDMDELNEVIAFGRDVMQGKFRSKPADESASAAKSAK